MSTITTRDNWQSEVPRMITHFRNCKLYGGSMYREAMGQYRNMAKGGSGGDLQHEPEKDWQESLVEALQPVEVRPTIRNYNYPGLPNEFFAAVLLGLGEHL